VGTKIILGVNEASFTVYLDDLLLASQPKCLLLLLRRLVRYSAGSDIILRLTAPILSRLDADKTASIGIADHSANPV
jgi:hypothetical protein